MTIPVPWITHPDEGALPARKGSVASFPVRFLAALLLAAWIVPGASARAAETKQAGKPLSTQAKKAEPSPLEPHVRQLRDTRDRLIFFLSGKKPIDVPPEGLFTVDLANEEAVARRVKELSAKVTAAKSPPGASESRDLEVQIDRLRLEFLSLPKERRNALVSAQKAAREHSETAEELAQEQSSAQQEQDEATRSLQIAEEQARTGKSAGLRELAAQRAVVEKTRQDLAGIQVQWTTSLKERTLQYRETAEKLSSLAAVLAAEKTPQETRQAYLDVAEIWRGLVDRVFSGGSEAERYEPVPRIPPFSESLAGRLAGDPETKAYRAAYQDLSRQHDALIQLREKRFAEEKDNLYRLLLQSGRLRSQLLRESIRLGQVSSFGLSAVYFGDLLREVRIVPTRWVALFYSRMMDLRGQEGAGLIGFFWQAALVLLLVALPFAAYFLLKRLGGWLDRQRVTLIRLRMSKPWAGSLALFLQRVNPYFPWVAMLLGVWAAGRWIRNTALAEAGAVLPYLSIYIWYRLFRIFVSSAMGIVAFTGGLHNLSALGERIDRTVKRIGIFFFLSLGVLHATQVVVGKALVYHLVSAIMIYLGIFVCAIAARQWRQEIVTTAERVLPGKVAGSIKGPCLGTASSWIASLPSLLLVLGTVAVSRSLEWATRFEFFKRIGAEIFRRRLEGTAAKAQRETLSREYLEWFDLYAPPDPSLLIEPETGIAGGIRASVTAWAKDETEEHSLVIYGDKGIGKSSLLQVVGKEFEGLRILHTSVPPKLCTREGVLSFFGKLLETDLSGGPANLVKKFSGGEKTLLLVDDAQNLFLASLGGFEGYRALLDLINARTKELFWCAAINRRSWDYLSGVFGVDHSFRNAVRVPPWSDADIRKLILARHRRTEKRLSYDAIIRATHSSGDYGMVAELEAQFFRLLWDQSRGIPRTAMLLWLSSLTPSGNGEMRVGIPRPTQARVLETTGEDSLFVFASIIRHENLSTEEIMATTNLPEGVVRHAIRIGMESHSVARSPDGRYRVTPEAQFFLNQLLERKNFLYE